MSKETTRGAVSQIITDAIEELNEQLDEGRKVATSEDTRLIGASAAVDSLGFVTLVSIIEELIEDELEASITVVDAKAFSSQRSPFATVGSLTDHVVRLVEGA